ncbi:MAG: amidase [Mycolicibacterium sp.]|uniref:amidase n=1 Tax=Mycolicibacterium sp. TaxID=2320850 RepID=UPI003D14250A
MDLNRLTAAEGVRRIGAGELSSEALVRDCLARIEAREPTIRAWAWLDPARAIADARAVDTRIRERPGSVGPLAGVPFGVKDVIDTADYPTEHNTRAHQGRRPGWDAPCVAILRAAGGIVLGKTETVELAALGRHPVTTNPHDVSRTPGGSSSGSAAAVADAMVPLALGTQTGGSIIRPAAFCGVFGFKPTYGTVSLEGVSGFAPSLDTIGWHARSAEDLALLATVYGIVDSPIPVAPLPTALRIGVCRTPEWSKATPAALEALASAAERLAGAGARVEEVELPGVFAGLDRLKETIMYAEGATTFRVYDRVWPHLAAPWLLDMVHRGPNRGELRTALDEAASLRPAFDAIAAEWDALLTPSAPGEAPDTTTTGDSVFNGIWTVLHAPCAAIPGFTGPSGLPVGVQLVAPRYADARLLAVTAAAASVIAGQAWANWNY